MHVYRINRPLFSLPEEHPAHRFLRAFIACLRNCVGAEISYGKYRDRAVDQEWYSEVDDRKWSFLAFVYTHLAFDIELDGWLSGADRMTESERQTLEALPHLRSLLAECKAAAANDDNERILEMVREVEEVFDLLEHCIRTRVEHLRKPDSETAPDKT